VSALIVDLDGDLAGHLALAIRRYRLALSREGWAEHPGLAQLEEMARRVNERQRASTSVKRRVRPEDPSGADHRRYLTRSEVCELAGVSLRTVDRWIRSRELPSTKHQQTRRIARADLDRFLATT
jgi:excisionase family DNA binding protein